MPVLSDVAEPGFRHDLVHQGGARGPFSLTGFQAYVCGVPVMTQAAGTDFIAAGLPEDEFFADAFVTRAEPASAGP